MMPAHKIALDPNDGQETHFRQAAGTARLASTWAWDQWQQQYDARKGAPTLPKPSEAALRRQLNARKREQFPWMLDVTKSAPRLAIIHWGHAFQNFFGGTGSIPPLRRRAATTAFRSQFTVKGGKV